MARWRRPRGGAHICRRRPPRRGPNAFMCFRSDRNRGRKLHRVAVVGPGILEEDTMKIASSLLVLATAFTLAGCEKSSTDTANPDDATATPPASEEPPPVEETPPAEEPAADAPVEGEAAPEGRG